MQSFHHAAAALDRDDPLAHCRARFSLPPGVVYLDGNSLGALPRCVPERLRRAVELEWGGGLIRSWNDADWYPAPKRVAAKIAPLIGAAADQVIAADSTTVNLFKVLTAAMEANPKRRIVLCERDNFPTDSYLAHEAAKRYGKTVRTVDQDTVEAAITEAGDALCAVTLTHVHYKTGRLHDLPRITALVQAQGGRIIWDLAHSAGAVPVALDEAGADYAVGCGYKYLNGGPGAPAFAYVRRDHLAEFTTPLVGWHGHAAPFDFSPEWRAHPGIERLLVGTAPMLSMLALEAALDAFDGVSMKALREKSLSLTRLFIAGYDACLARHGLGLVTPREDAHRGSQVALTHPDGYAIMQAAIERGVIGDFRAPDILRFGFAPLYVSHADVVRAVETLDAILTEGLWREPRYAAKKAVT
ncbi:MAG: kynureninase [Casimicrobiaceae bacterium]